MISEVLALVLLGLASTISAQDPNQQQQGQAPNPSPPPWGPAPALMYQTTMMMIMMLQKDGDDKNDIMLPLILMMTQQPGQPQSNMMPMLMMVMMMDKEEDKDKEKDKDKKNCNCGEAKGLKIIGGTGTEVNEYPWQVGIAFVGLSDGETPLCGGSIISDLHILTAAHCTLYPQLSPAQSQQVIRVSVGEYSITDDDIHIRTISSVTIHPGYNPENLANDLAILTLSSPLAFSKAIAPICLPANSSNTFAGETATVIGWGRTSPGGNQSTSLQEVDLTVTSNDYCKTNYSDLADPWPILRTNICAGDPGQSACQGDSGGPLFIKENGRYAEIGIVSWGMNECLGKPGVFARVTEYKDWIRSMTPGAKILDTKCMAE